MSCPICRASKLVEISLSLGPSTVVMKSCSRCDTRWWAENGEQVGLDGVLELAATRR